MGQSWLFPRFSFSKCRVILTGCRSSCIHTSTKGYFNHRRWLFAKEPPQLDVKGRTKEKKSEARYRGDCILNLLCNNYKLIKEICMQTNRDRIWKCELHLKKNKSCDTNNIYKSGPRSTISHTWPHTPAAG